MPFQIGVGGATRLTSGVTPDIIHQAMAAAVFNAKIVDPGYVWMTLDDEVIPAAQPPSDKFITVRYPSLIWSDGDVQGGDNNVAIVSSLRVKGQSRHTIWLMDEINYIYGSSETLLNLATGQGPGGSKYLGQMVKLFWEQDLVNEAGHAITTRPFRLVSIEMPEGVTASRWRPFRLTWEVSFVWDLTKEG